MKYFLRKVGWLLFAVFVALTINFFLPRMMPGDPASILIHKLEGLEPSALKAVQSAFGLDENQTLLQQYWDYLKNLAHGDLGISISQYPTRVWDVLAKAIPWTLGLTGIATIFSFVLGTLAGIQIAWKRKSSISNAFLGLFLFIRSFPYFWFGLILVYFLAFQNPWFPLGGAYSYTVTARDGWEFVKSVLYHGFLPGLTITISSMGYWMLTIRNNMINVLAEDYITVAKAKGLSNGRIRNIYAAKNAILPSISGFAMSLGFVIGGSLLTEMVFSYPGVGFMLYQAVQEQDYPLLQAIFLFIILSVLVSNFLADLVMMALDPRVRDGGKR